VRRSYVSKCVDIAGLGASPKLHYDYLAVGVPCLAVTPPGAAVRYLSEASGFHHIDHRDAASVEEFLRRAAADRTVLRPGRRGAGPTRDQAAEAVAWFIAQVAGD
jgi:hypothetical protein